MHAFEAVEWMVVPTFRRHALVSLQSVASGASAAPALHNTTESISAVHLDWTIAAQAHGAGPGRGLACVVRHVVLLLVAVCLEHEVGRHLQRSRSFSGTTVVR